MNQNSYICKFINENRDNWEELLSNMNIKVKKEGPLAIFNYSIEADFYNPIVQEARGIIINVDELEVVCWPFRKFGNFNEPYVDTIDWESARVLEKVDGSIIKLWFNKITNNWQFSTNATISASDAPISGLFDINYMDLIKQAINYNQIPYDKLDKDTTYIFELVSPISRVVIYYYTTTLYHTGTRNNITGKEEELDIGIIKPKVYSLNSLEDCCNAAKELNKTNSENEVTNEGFVVVDKNYHRIKIKSPDYLIVHRIAENKVISKVDCIDMLINRREDIDKVIKAYPSLTHIVRYYDYKLEELKHSADVIGLFAIKIYEEYSQNRKEVAKILLKHKLSFIGFRCIDNNKSGSENLLRLTINQITNLIDDYIEEDLSYLFN